MGEKISASYLPLAIAAESKMCGGVAYVDYQTENDMREAELIELMIQRKLIS